MHTPTDTAPGPGLLNRLLGVERHEYAPVAWSFVYFFCVLSAYYMLRPVRETMGVGSGSNTLPFLFMASFAIMLLATPVFGWITSRYPRRLFLPWVYGFFVINIVMFWAVFADRIDDGRDHVWLGRMFFVWISVFNLFVVSVFWSFMADIYTREQGRRLFGLLSSGGSIGALLGGIATSLLVTRIGFQNLFPLSALLLLFAIFCIRRLGAWTSAEQSGPSATVADHAGSLGGGVLSGVTHATSSNYFRAIAAASIIASLLGTALYFFRNELVAVSIADANLRTQFFSNINIASNFLTIIGQMFLVRYVVRRFGIGVALAILPALSILCFAWVALDPTLIVVAYADILRRATGFTFGKPSTDMLYSVVTSEEKYKTKNFIDTTVYRFGDVIGIWAIRLLMVTGMTVVSLLMIPFAVAWTAIAVWLGRDYRRRARELRDKGLA
ncbi:MAG: MFS transporter [Woeseiaceae bacterium]|nr:MFS transporter [Woeseiaceae bacterium]